MGKKAERIKELEAHARRLEEMPWVIHVEVVVAGIGGQSVLINTILLDKKISSWEQDMSSFGPIQKLRLLRG